LGGGVGGCEFGGEIRQVSEGEFSRVGLVADSEKAELVLYEVAAGWQCQRLGWNN